MEPRWVRCSDGTAPTDAGLQTKPDNFQYRGYRFGYTGNYTLVASEERVYLQDFVATSNSIGRAGDATYWIERQITRQRPVPHDVPASPMRDRGLIGNGLPSSQRRAARRRS